MSRRRTTPSRSLGHVARQVSRRFGDAISSRLKPSPAPAPAPAAPTPVRQALFELIEPRVLMSADPFQVSASVAAGGAAQTTDWLLRVHDNDDGNRWMQVVDQATGLLVAERLAADVSEVVIVGADHVDDHLTVDLSRPFGVDITYHGGAAGDDAITVQGGSFQSTVVNYTGPQDGVITLDGQRVAFTGLEPTTITSATADLVLTASGGNDVARLEDNGNSPADGFSSFTSVNGGFETTVFRNPTNSLTLNLGDGNDTIDLRAFTTTQAALRVDGQGGVDRVDVSGSFRQAGRDVSVAAETISLNAGSSIDTRPLGAGTAGNVSLNATAQASLDPFEFNIASGTPTAQVLMDRASILANNVNLVAQAAVSATADIGGASFASVTSNPTARVDVFGDSVIDATGNVNLFAVTFQTLLAQAQPEGSGNLLGDAAAATIVLNGVADAHVGNTSRIEADGTLALLAGQQVSVNAVANAASRTAGGSVAFIGAALDTDARVDGNAILSAGGALTIQAVHTGAVVASAVSSVGGMQAGSSAVDTTTEQRLGQNSDLARTSDGVVGVAAAVAITTVDATTSARLATGGSVQGQQVAVVGRGDLDVSAIADASRTSATGTAVGAAVAINDSNLVTSAALGGSGRYGAGPISVRTEAPNSSILLSDATSGVGGSSGTGVAGALAVTVGIGRSDARIEDGAVLELKDTAITVSALSNFEIRAEADALNNPLQRRFGVGASVAVNVADVGTTAAWGEGATATGLAGLSVTASGTGVARASSVGGAAGGTAIAPSVAINVAELHAAAAIEPGAALAASGNVTVSAGQSASAFTSATGSATGGNAALGASVGIGLSDASATATTERSLALQGTLLVSTGLFNRTTTDAQAASRGAATSGPGGTVDAQAASQRNLGNAAAGARGAQGAGVPALPSARTADGAVAVAAALAVNSSQARAQALLGGGTEVSAAAVDIRSSVLDTSAADASGFAMTAADKPAVGAAVAINVARMDNLAQVGPGSSVSADGDITLRAALQPFGDFLRHDARASAQSGAGTGGVGVAGALAINVGNRTTDASVGTGSTLKRGEPGNLDISAASDSRDRATAGAVVRTSPGGLPEVGVGASVAINVADTTTRATVADGATLSGGFGTRLAADSAHQMATTASGGAAGGTAVTPVVAVSNSHTDTLARLGRSDSPYEASGGDIAIAAVSNDTVTTDARGAASGDTSVGAALALGIVNVSTRAELARSVATSGNVGVTTEDRSASTTNALASVRGAAADSAVPDVDTQAASQRGVADSAATSTGARTTGDSAANPSARTSDGRVGVAAAVGINLHDATAEARIADQVQVVGADVVVDSAMKAQAAADANGSTFLTPSSAGTAGTAPHEAGPGTDAPTDAAFGAAVAINLAKVQHRAAIGNEADLRASKLLRVEARLTDGDRTFRHAFGATATSGASAGTSASSLGIAGSVAINISDVQTEATIGDGVVVEAGDSGFTLRADTASFDNAQARPGDGASGDVGLGASVAVNVASHTTRAAVGSDTTLTTRGDAIFDSLASRTVTTRAEASAVGGTAITPVAAVTVANDITEVRLARGGGVSAGGDLVAQASHGGSVLTDAVGSATGRTDGAGIGASVAVSVAQMSTRVETQRNLAAAGVVSLAARDFNDARADAGASASGGRSEAGSGRPADGVDQEIGAQRSLGDSIAAGSGVAGSGSDTPASARTAEGGLSVAAAVAVNVMRDRTTTAVGDGVTVSGRSVELESRSTALGSADADGSAAAESKGTGIGAAVAIGVGRAEQAVNVGTGARIVAAEGVRLTVAENDGGHRFEALATAGGGGVEADVGVAGALAVNVADATTVLAVGANAGIDNGGDDIVMRNSLLLESRAEAVPESGATGAAGGVGVGASVAVNVADTTAGTTVADGAKLTSDGGIDAATSLDVAQTTLARQGAKGDTGVAGAVAVSIGNSAADTTLGTGSLLGAAKTIAFETTQRATAETTAAGRAIAADTAVGAAFGLTVLNERTSTRSTGSSFDGAAGITLRSSGEADGNTVVTASAAGGKSDDSGSTADDDGVDQEVARQRALGDSVAAGTGTTASGSAGTPSAGTSDGTVSVAAAVGISLVDASTQTTLSGGTAGTGGRLTVESLARGDGTVTASGQAVVEGAGTGVGAAVAVGVGRVDNLARIAGATVNADALTVRAANLAGDTGAERAHTFAAGALAGGGGSGAKVGVAGAVAINVAATDAVADVAAGSTLTIGGGASRLQASQTGSHGALALPESAGAAGDVGVGASVAVSVQDSGTTAALGNGARWASGGALDITATSQQAAFALARGGAEGGTAIAPVVAIAIANNDTTARVGTGPLATMGDLRLQATQRATTTAAAEGSATAKNAAIGASVAVAVANNEVLSQTARNLVSTGSVALGATGIETTTSSAKASAAGADGASSGGRNVDQQAAAQRAQGDSVAAQSGQRSSGGAQAASAQTADGKVAVAAAVAVTVDSHRVNTEVGASTTLTAARTVSLDSVAGSDGAARAEGTATLPGSGTGVGAAVAVNVGIVSNLAQVGAAATVRATGLTVQALGTGPNDGGPNTMKAEARSGGGGREATVGIAGALAINVSSLTTEAVLRDGARAQLSTTGSATDSALRAQGTLEDTALAEPSSGGGAGANGETAVGASVALNIGTMATRAGVQTDAVFTGGRDLDIAASQSHTMTTTAEGSSRGGTAVTPVVALTIANNTAEAVLAAGTTLSVGRNLSAGATHVGRVDTDATGSTAATGSAGVGASVALSFVNDTTRTLAQRDLRAGGDTTLAAISWSRNDTDAVASVTGGRPESEDTPASGIDGLLGQQRSFGNAQATDNGSAGTGGTATPSAETSDGTVSVAAAVGLTVAGTDTRVELGNGRRLTTGGAALLDSRANTSASTGADGSATAQDSAGVGAAVAINVAHVDNAARLVNNSIVEAKGLTVSATTFVPNNDFERSRFDATARSGAGGGTVGVAGALALNVTNVETEARAAGGSQVTLNGGNATFTAGSSSSDTARAEPALDFTGGAGEDVGVGASVALNIAAVRVESSTAPTVTFTATSDLALNAASTHGTTTVARGGAEGGTAVTPVVAITIQNDTTRAQVEGTPGVTPALAVAGNLALTATQRSTASLNAEGSTTAGDVGVGASFGLIVKNDAATAQVQRNLAVGGNVALTADNASASATVAKASVRGAEGEDDADGSVTDRAEGQRDFADDKAAESGVRGSGGTATPDAETSGGSVVVGAAVGLNIANSVTSARFSNAVAATAGGDIELRARANVDASALADGSAVSEEADVGVGAAVAINVANVTNEAFVGRNGVIAARSLVVDAGMGGDDRDFRHAFGADATSGAGAGDVGVAGSVALNFATVTTQGVIETGTVATLSGGGTGATSAARAAQSTTSTTRAMPSDGGASGGDVGVGASFALDIGTHTTRAEVENGARLRGTAGGLDIAASSAHAVTVEAGNGAKGDVAVGAAVAIAVTPNNTLARLGTGNALAATGDVSVRAEHRSQVSTKATGESGGSDVGVGASVALAIAPDTTRAEIARDVSTSGGIAALASGSTRLDTESRASANGAASLTDGGSSADSESAKQRDYANSKAGTTATNPTAKSTVDGANAEAAGQGGSGGSSVGVAAAIALNIGVTEVRGQTTAGRTFSAGGALELGATGDTDTRAQAIATSVLNDTNVGAALGMNVAVITHEARLGDGSTATAQSLRMRAGTGAEDIHTVRATALAGAGASQTGVSGSIGLNVVTDTTTSAIGTGSRVTVGSGGTSIDTSQRTELQNIVGAGAVGRNTSVGGSIGVNVVTDTVRTHIGDGAVVTSVGAATVTTTHNLRNFDDPNIPGDPSLMVVGGAAGGDAAVAGSVAVNVLTLDTRTTLGAGSALQVGDAATGASATLISRSDTRLVSLAGALAGSLNSVGIGAGVDVTVMNNTVAMDLAATSTLSATGNLFSVALSSDNLTAVAAALSLSGSSVAVAGGIDVLVVNRSTQATSGAGATLRAGGTLTFGAAASDRIEQVAANAAGSGSSVSVAGSIAVTSLNATTRGALGTGNVVNAGRLVLAADDTATVGITAGSAAVSGGSAGIGASTTTFVHTNVVEAIVGSGSTLTLGGGTVASEISANSSESVRTIAAGAGVSAGSVGVAGSATVNVLNETTRASIEDGVVVTVGNATTTGDLRVRANDSTTLLGLAGGVGGGSSVGVGAGADVGVINKTTEAWIDGATRIDANGNVLVSASAREDIRSISATAGIGGSVGVMGSASVEVINIATRAWIGDDPRNATDPVAAAASVVASGSVVVSATDDTKVSLLAGNIGGAGSVAVGAAAAVAVVNKQTEAFVAPAVLVTARGLLPAVAVTAGGYAERFDPASGAQGEVGLAPRGSGSRDANNDGSNDLDNGSFTGKRTAVANTSTIQGLAVTANSTDNIEAIGVSGSAAGAVAVNVAGVVPVVNTLTQAYIGAGAQVNTAAGTPGAGQGVLVAASNDLHHLGVAGVASLAGTAAVGPGVDVSILNPTTKAYVDGGAVVNAAGTVGVAADSRQDVLVVAAGLAVSGVAGIGGAVPVVSIASTTESYIGDSATVKAGHSVLVTARDFTKADMIAGAGGLGLAVGVGASVGVLNVAKTTSAFIADDAVVDALALGGTTRVPQGLFVNASSTEDLFNLAAAMGVGLYAGVAGGVTVTTVDSNTSAYIGRDARINTDAAADGASQVVQVRADNLANITTFAGAVGGGIAGIGGGVDVGWLQNDTQAFIATGARVNATSAVDVAAFSTREVRGNAIAGGVGLVGINAAVGVWTVGAAYNTSYSNGSSTANALVGSDGRRADVDASGQAGRTVQPLTSTLGNYSSSDRNGGAAAPDNTQLQGSAIASANSRFAALAPTQTTVTDRLAGAPGEIGTRAYIDGGADVRSGNSVTLSASETNRVNMLIGSGSIGLVAVGAGVGVLNVDANVSSFVAGRVEAAGNLTLNAAVRNNLSTLGIAGTVGFVGLGAAVTVASDTSDAAAYLADGAVVARAATVTLSAVGERALTGTTFGLNVGAAAVGASFSDLTSAGTTRAYVADADVGQVGGLSVGNLTMAARDVSQATANTTAIAGGAVVISANFADVEVRPTVESALRPNAAVRITGNLSLDSASFTDADAQMLVPSIGLAAFTVGRATADIAPAVDAGIRTLTPVVVGGSASIVARHNVEGTNSLQFSRGADAKVNSPTGGGITGNANLPTATSRAAVTSTLLAGTSLQTGGDATFAARSYDRASADSDRLSIGVVALGASTPTATVSSATLATVAGNLTAGGNVSVQVVGRGDAIAQADAPSGGLVSANGIVATATSRPTATAEVNGTGNTVTATGNVAIGSQFGALADARGFTFNAGLTAVGATLARADALPVMLAQVGGSSRINAGGGIAVTASDGTTGGTVARAEAHVPGAGLANAVNGGVALATARPDIDTRASASARLDAAGLVRFDASGTQRADATAKALSLSLGNALGTTVATATANGSVQSVMPADVVRAGGLTVAAALNGSATALGEAPAAGLVAGAGSNVTASFSPVIEATLGHTAAARTIAVTGDVNVVATGAGTASATANGLSIGLGALGVMNATATTAPLLTARVTGPTTLNATGAVSIRGAFNDAGGNGASARADAPGGGLVSGNGAIATATARGVLDASIDSAATVNAGSSLTVAMNSRNSASASTRALSIGGAALGTSLPTATVSEAVRAHVDGTSTSGGATTVRATYNGLTTALGDASGGGILSANGAIVTATTRPVVEAFAGLTGASRTYATSAGAFNLSATATTAAITNVNGLSVGAAALGVLSSTATVNPAVLAEVRGTSRFNGSGLTLSAIQNGTGANATAESPATVGLLGAIIGANPRAEAIGAVNARTNGTTTVDGGIVGVNAGSLRTAVATADALGIGALGVGSSAANALAGGTTNATLAGTVLQSGSVAVTADHRGTATTAATSAAGGLVAGNGATASSTAAGSGVATIAAGASVVSAGEVRVAATGASIATATANGAVGGLLGIGNTRASATSAPSLTASIGAATVNAGSLTLQALHEPAGNSAIARSTGTGGGIVAGNIVESSALANARTEASTSTSSTLRTTGAVALTAGANNTALATSDANTGGVVGIGTTDPTATATGSARALLGGTLSQSTTVDVTARATTTARADGEAATGGVIAGVGADVRATASPSVFARILAGSNITASQLVRVTATSSADALTIATGYTGGLAALGSTTAVSNVLPVVDARIEGTARVAAGGLTIAAIHNADALGNALANRGAHATATAGTGGVIAGNSATAIALTRATTTAAVDNGARLAITERVELTARSHDDADATSLATSGGLLALGAVATDAQGRSTTTARITTPAAFSAGSIVMTGTASGDVRALQSATVGGLLAFQTGRTALATFAPVVTTALDGAPGVPISVVNSVTLTSRSTGTVDAESRGVAGGAVALVDSRATGTYAPTVSTSLGGSTTLNAGGAVTLRAFNNTDANGGTFTTNAVGVRSNSSVGGIGGVDTGTESRALTTANVNAAVTGGAVINAGSLNIEAKSRTFETASANGNAGGVLAAGKPRSFVDVTNNVTAQVGAGARATLSGGMTMLAHTDNIGSVNTSGGKGGLLAFGGADSRMTINNSVRALLGNGAVITAPLATVSMLTLNSASLNAGVTSRADGGISNSEAAARLFYTSNNEARIGRDARIDANRADIAATDVGVNLVSSASSATLAVGSNSRAEAQVSAFMRTTTTVETGATVRGDALVRLAAITSGLRTTTDARAFIDLGLVGDSTAVSDNNVNQKNCVVAEAGSTILTYSLQVEAPSAYLSNGYTRLARAEANTVVNVITTIVEVSCRTGLAIATLGLSEIFGFGDDVCTEVRTVIESVTGGATPIYRGIDQRVSCVEFNATVRTPPPRLVTVDISAGGLVTAVGVNVRELADRFVIDELRPVAAAQVLLDAGGGMITGTARFEVEDDLGSLIVNNLSGKAIELGGVRTTQDKPTVFDINGYTDDFDFEVVNRIGVADLEVNSRGDVLLGGLFDMGGGKMRLNTDGSVLATNDSARLVTSDLGIVAGGRVGGPGGPLATTLVGVTEGGLGFATSEKVDARLDVRAGGDVGLRVGGEQRGAGTFDLKNAGLVAGGSAVLDVVDAGTFTIDPKTGKLVEGTVGSNISFGELDVDGGIEVVTPEGTPVAIGLPGGGIDGNGVLNIDTDGDFSFKARGDLTIGQVLAGGNVTLEAGGSIIDLDRTNGEVDIRGRSITLTAGGSILGGGGLSPLLIDTAGAGSLTASANGSIALTETSGSLRLAGLTSLKGDVSLEVRGGSVIDGNAADTPDITAQRLTLNVNGSFGAATNAIDTAVGSIAGTVLGGANIASTGALQLAGHGPLSVAGDLTVVSRGPLTVGPLDERQLSSVSVQGTARLTVVDTDRGDDNLTVGGGANVFAQRIEMSAGDRLRIAQQGSLSAAGGVLLRADVDADADRGRGGLVILSGSVRTPDLQIVTGADADDIRIGRVLDGTVATVTMGAGNDQLTIGWQADGRGRLGQINGAIVAVGSGGNDIVLLDRSGDAPGVPGTVGSTRITGFGLGAEVTLRSIESVKVIEPEVPAVAPRTAPDAAPAPLTLAAEAGLAEGGWAAAPAVMGAMHFDARAGEWRPADGAGARTAAAAADLAAAPAAAATERAAAVRSAGALAVDWDAQLQTLRAPFAPLGAQGLNRGGRRG